MEEFGENVFGDATDLLLYSSTSVIDYPENAVTTTTSTPAPTTAIIPDYTGNTVTTGNKSYR